MLWFWAVVAAGGIGAIMSPVSNEQKIAAGQLDNMKDLFPGSPLITSAKFGSRFSAQGFAVELIENVQKYEVECHDTLFDDVRTSSKSEDLAAILLTSGSTGRSKAVQCTHSQLIASVRAKKAHLNSHGQTFMTWILFDHSANFCEIHMQSRYLHRRLLGPLGPSLCWMVPSLILMALDQAVRPARTCTTHIGTTAGRFGFHRAMATVQAIGGGESEEDVCVRLDFDFEHEAWLPGQHFYLCFPSLSIWQSHPFTVISSPDASSGSQHHTYLLRARKGQTAEFEALAGQTIVTVMTGPYGPVLPGDATPNVLTVAGGTGVTFTLSIVFESRRQSLVPQALVEFVCVVRRAEDLLWLGQELGHLESLLQTNPASRLSSILSWSAQTSAVVTSKSLAVAQTQWIATSAKQYRTWKRRMVLNSTGIQGNRFWTIIVTEENPFVITMQVILADRISAVLCCASSLYYLIFYGAQHR